MDSRTQHARNAAKEKRYIADAARDAANMNRSGSHLWAEGHRVEAAFAFEEARNAESWRGKRTGILKREERLARR